MGFESVNNSQRKPPDFKPISIGFIEINGVKYEAKLHVKASEASIAKAKEQLNELGKTLQSHVKNPSSKIEIYSNKIKLDEKTVIQRQDESKLTPIFESIQSLAISALPALSERDFHTGMVFKSGTWEVVEDLSGHNTDISQAQKDFYHGFFGDNKRDLELVVDNEKVMVVGQAFMDLKRKQHLQVKKGEEIKDLAAEAKMKGAKNADEKGRSYFKTFFKLFENPKDPEHHQLHAFLSFFNQRQTGDLLENFVYGKEGAIKMRGFIRKKKVLKKELTETEKTEEKKIVDNFSAASEKGNQMKIEITDDNVTFISESIFEVYKMDDKGQPELDENSLAVVDREFRVHRSYMMPRTALQKMGAPKTKEEYEKLTTEEQKALNDAVDEIQVIDVVEEKIALPVTTSKISQLFSRIRKYFSF